MSDTGGTVRNAKMPGLVTVRFQECDCWTRLVQGQGFYSSTECDGVWSRTDATQGDLTGKVYGANLGLLNQTRVCKCKNTPGRSANRSALL